MYTVQICFVNMLNSIMSIFIKDKGNVFTTTTQ